MKDSRITVWNNTQSNLTGTTTNTGPAIDLFAQGAMQGGTNDGTGIFGISVEIIQTFVSGTQSTDWTWDVSADNSTWHTTGGGYIGTVALTAAGNAKLRSNLRTQYRYARLVASNTGTGASTSVAYAEDGGGFTGPGAISNA